MDIRWDELRKKLETAKSLKEVLEKGGWHGKPARRDFVDWILKILKKNPNLWDLENRTIPKLEEKGDKRVAPLKIAVEIIKQTKDLYGLKYEETILESLQKTEEKRFIEFELEETIEGVIGRVAVTLETPAEPYRFHFWLKPDEDIYLEPGELIEVGLDKDNYAIGLVETLRASSEKRSVFVLFLFLS